MLFRSGQVCSISVLGEMGSWVAVAGCKEERTRRAGMTLWPRPGSSARRGMGKSQSLFSEQSLCFREEPLTVEKIPAESREA